MQSLMEVFSAQSKQFRSLILDIPSIMAAVLLGVTNTLTQLESISFRKDYISEFSDMLVHAPRVRLLHVAGPRFPNSQFVWLQLQELTLETILSMQNYETIFNSASNLQKCTIHMASSRNDEAIHSISPITLPSLQSLSLYFGLEQDPSNILSLLHAPTLAELKIPLVSIISVGSLKTLRIGLPPKSIQMDLSRWVDIWRVMPKLETLALTNNSLAQLSQISPNPFGQADAYLMPNLRQLEFDCRSLADMPIALDIIQWCLLPDRPSALKHVVLIWSMINILTGVAVNLGGSLNKASIWPWHKMAAELAEQGIVIINWPFGVPLPPDLWEMRTKGILALTYDQLRKIVEQFSDPEYPLSFEKCKNAADRDGLEDCTLPVASTCAGRVKGAPKIRRLFANNTVDEIDAAESKIPKSEASNPDAHTDASSELTDPDDIDAPSGDDNPDCKFHLKTRYRAKAVKPTAPTAASASQHQHSVTAVSSGSEGPKVESEATRKRKRSASNSSVDWGYITSAPSKTFRAIARAGARRTRTRKRGRARGMNAGRVTASVSSDEEADEPDVENAPDAAALPPALERRPTRHSYPHSDPAGMLHRRGGSGRGTGGHGHAYAQDPRFVYSMRDAYPESPYGPQRPRQEHPGAPPDFYHYGSPRRPRSPPASRYYGYDAPFHPSVHHSLANGGIPRETFLPPGPPLYYHPDAYRHEVDHRSMYRRDVSPPRYYAPGPYFREPSPYDERP
ncbi:hypothetical protein HWV62_13265 [Athelia sp. TMB]|nr:hypothetical protein HWV62_13265 [Athelia sp. TMB]